MVLIMLPVTQENVSLCAGVKRPKALSIALLCIWWNWACQHLLGVKNFSFETELFPYMFYGIIADR